MACAGVGCGALPRALCCSLLELNSAEGEEALPLELEFHQNEANTTASFRWLMGEDAPAFNGAIRDMWMPRCFGHPGSVGRSLCAARRLAHTLRGA